MGWLGIAVPPRSAHCPHYQVNGNTINAGKGVNPAPSMTLSINNLACHSLLLWQTPQHDWRVEKPALLL